jgi:hypothetical protein
MRRPTALLCVAVLALAVYGAPAGAQTRSRSLLTGYGTATFDAVPTTDFASNFTASVSPVLLYSMGSDILFESELEFGVSGAETTTSLEYAQIDYLGFESVQVIAGKFLVPFGVFGERLHPSWINKLPTAPILFGHGHGGVAEDALLPIMTDVGLMLRWAQPMGSTFMLDMSGYVTQGPRLAPEDGDGHADDHGPAGDAGSGLAPPVAFGTSFGDNNTNKMVGGRIGVVRGPSFEAYVSGFHAMYDEGDYLDYVGGALSVEVRRGTFELRGKSSSNPSFVI